MSLYPVEAGRAADCGSDLGGRRVDARSGGCVSRAEVAGSTQNGTEHPAVRLPSELPPLNPTASRILLAILIELTTMDTLERGTHDHRDDHESVGDIG